MRLQVWMVIVLTTYALLAGYLFFSMPQRAMPMLFARSVAEREVQTSDLPQLQSDLRFVISYAREIQRDRVQRLAKILF